MDRIAGERWIPRILSGYINKWQPVRGSIFFEHAILEVGETSHLRVRHGPITSVQVIVQAEVTIDVQLHPVPDHPDERRYDQVRSNPGERLADGVQIADDGRQVHWESLIERRIELVDARGPGDHRVWLHRLRAITSPDPSDELN